CFLIPICSVRLVSASESGISVALTSVIPKVEPSGVAATSLREELDRVAAERAGPWSGRVADAFVSDLVLSSQSAAFVFDGRFFGLACFSSAGVVALSGTSCTGAGRQCAVISKNVSPNSNVGTRFIAQPSQKSMANAAGDQFDFEQLRVSDELLS